MRWQRCPGVATSMRDRCVSNKDERDGSPSGDLQDKPVVLDCSLQALSMHIQGSLSIVNSLLSCSDFALHVVLQGACRMLVEFILNLYGICKEYIGDLSLSLSLSKKFYRNYYRNAHVIF